MGEAVTPNQLNRRIVADWLRGTSEGCSVRQLLRRLPGNCLPWSWSASGVMLLLVRNDTRGRTSTCFSGRNRAEATAKAAKWIMMKGWEVSNA
jgi:hypothetical protein